jgi:hypothetical protein
MDEWMGWAVERTHTQVATNPTRSNGSEWTGRDTMRSIQAYPAMHARVRIRKYGNTGRHGTARTCAPARMSP